MRFTGFSIIVVLAAKLAGAQGTPDTARVGAHGSAPPRVTAAIASGAMRFADERQQQAITGVVRYHLSSALSLALSPTFARVEFPATLGGGEVSGLTDLPLELGVDHSFDIALSPTAGIAFGATLPLGNKSIAFGSGAVGANLSAGLGLSPGEHLSFHVGAGRSMTDYSPQSTLGASSGTWTDLEASYDLLERVTATAGFNGELSSPDTGRAARAVATALAFNVGGPYTLTVNGARGLSGAAARWTVAIAFGTDFAGVNALGSSSPIQRFMRSLGGSSVRGMSGGTPGGGHGRP
jgi:hypothetical protein